MSSTEFYRVFGGILKSDLEIPDLHPIEPVPEVTWRLRKATDEIEPFGGETLGTEPVTSKANVTLLRRGEEYRLDFEDTGAFDVLDGGHEIIWYPKSDSDHEAAAVDVLGRCLPLAFHAGGSLCLHGSAVAFDHGTIAFLAPKHHGKSTTALALARSGARLVSDDALPVTLTDPPLAYPGVHSVRLWADSAEQVAFDRESRVGIAGKLVVNDLKGADVMDEPSPLSAVYLIAPILADADKPAANRTKTNSIEATLAMVGQAKVGGLLTGSEAPRSLERASRIADKVPVYRLELMRDFDRLDEVVGLIRSWHAELIAP
ncbi:MAG: hypothetical protein ACI9OJ_005770 [Myxococcota bacterium]|jgi:hypothetical protein